MLASIVDFIFNDPLFWTGYVAIMLMPLVASAIIYGIAPAFGDERRSFEFSTNAGIYGVVGLMPPAILLVLIPAFITIEDQFFTTNFYSILGLLLHLLTLFLAIDHFHKLSRAATAALSVAVFAGCWLYIVVFAALPKYMYLMLTVPEV